MAVSECQYVEPLDPAHMAILPFQVYVPADFYPYKMVHPFVGWFITHYRDLSNII